MTDHAKYLEKSLSNLDKVLELIDPSDTRTHDDKGNAVGPAHAIVHLFKQKLSRLLNLIAGDHEWHTEAKARKIVKYYLWHAKACEKNERRTQQIIQIYDKLSKIKRGQGHYAEGIEREWIEELAKTDPAQKRGETFVRLKDLPSIDSHLLFHIHADEFGSNSKLEGIQISDPLAYIYAYLKARQRHPGGQKAIPSPLLQEVKGALALAKTSNFTGLAKEQLEAAILQKKSMLVPGGWNGSPGHALYYEIIWESERTASFRIYNSGAGLDNHDKTLAGNKVKYQPYCEWKGISFENLRNKNFWKAIEEIRTYTTIPETSVHTRYSEKDVYGALRILLQPVQDAVEPDADRFPLHTYISPQKSGTCSARSLMAFLHTRMEINEYKRFRCSLQLQSLVDKVRKVKNQRPFWWSAVICATSPLPALIAKFVQNFFGVIDLSVEQRLIEKSRQKLSLSIDRLFRERVIDAQFLTKAQYELGKIDLFIADARKQRTQPTDLKTKNSYKAPNGRVLEKYIPNPKKALHQQIKDSETKISTQHFSHLAEALAALTCTDPILAQSTLEQLKSLGSKGWAEGEDLAAQTGLIKSLTKFPLDPEYWAIACSEDKGKASGMVSTLGAIAHVLFRTSFKVPAAHVIFPERAYALWKIQMIQSRLLPWIDKSLGKSVTFENSSLQSRLSHYEVFFRLSDPKMHQDLAHVTSQHNIVINERLSYGSQYESCFLQFQTFATDHDFVEHVLKAFPGLEGQIARESRGWTKMERSEQLARAYISKSMPDWVKAMRDANFYMRYIMTMPVADPGKVDRELDFSLKFSVIPSSNFCNLVFDLTGPKDDIRRHPGIQRYQHIGHNAIEDYTPLRFEGCHKKISSPAVAGFIEFLLDLYQRASLNSEKKLLVEDPKRLQIPMADEEFKELAHLFVSPGLQIIETVEYFTKHPQKLKDTDYQVLFFLLIFETSAMRAVEGNSIIARRLAHFIKGQAARFLAENEIQGAVFLLQTMRRLSRFYPNKPLLQNSLEDLTKLLQRDGLQPEERSLIYAEIAAHYGQKEKLSENETGELIKAFAYFKNHPLPAKWEDPSVEKEALQAIHTHAKAIEALLIKNGSPNQSFLNELAATLRPGHPHQIWEAILKPGEFVHFSSPDKKHAFYPLSGIFISLEAEIFVPADIREHYSFLKLFPYVKKVIAKPNGTFFFKDAKGRDTLIQVQGEELIIEQRQGEGEDSWCRFISNLAFLRKGLQANWLEIAALRILSRFTETNVLEEALKKFQSSFTSLYLLHNYTHWQSLKHPEKIYLHNRRNGEREYEAVCTGGCIKEVRSLADHTLLGQPSLCFTRFEDPSYIHEWYARGKIQKAELPRFGLSFTPDRRNPDRLLCDQFAGYYLQANDVHPELGSYRHYLTLKNEAGSCKVLVPNQQFSPNLVARECLLPSYGVNQNLTYSYHLSQSYHTYDLRPDGTLNPPSAEAGLYLAEILTLVQEYPKAAFYLRKYGNKLTEYTESEVEILQGLADTPKNNGDHDGNAAALRTFASFCLVKNAQEHRKKPQKNVIESLTANYLEYLGHYRKISALFLTPSEEIDLTSFLPSLTEYSIIIQRLKELLRGHSDPKLGQAYAERLQEILPNPSAQSGMHKNRVIPPSFEPDFYANSKPVNLKNKLITRLAAEIQDKAYSYFKIAKHGTEEEKKILRDSLAFVKNTGTQNQVNLALVLECVLDHPSSFPDYSRSQNNPITFSQWRTNSANMARKLLSEKLHVNPIGSRNAAFSNLTPPDFKLDRDEEPLAPLELRYSFPPGPSWADLCRQADCFTSSAPPPQTSAEPLKQWLESINPADAVERKEFHRLQNDLETYHSKPPGVVYKPNHEGLKKARELLGKNREENENLLEKLEREIQLLANRAPALPLEKAKQQFQKWGGLQKEITLDDVVVSFARMDADTLRKRNSALEEADLNLLFNTTGKYLQIASYEQQRNRCQATLEKLEALSREANRDLQEEYNLVQQLAADMLAHRCYDPVKYPAYLAFEYYAGILMREAQRDNLKAFLEGEHSNIVMEMIMGSGKSKVLLPLLGLLRADKNTLSLLIVPEPLFESISTDTQQILRDAFGQSLRALHFDRNTPLTVENLTLIVDSLASILDQRECLIMTGKSVQCLMLKLIEQEELHHRRRQADGPDPIPIDIRLLKSALRLLGKIGFPIIDEADTILNVLHEVCFSIGAGSPPRNSDVMIISELYDLLLNAPGLKKTVQLDCDPWADLDTPPLTEPLYHQKIKRPLAEAFVERLKTMHFDAEALTNTIHSFARQLSNAERSILLDYLCRDNIPQAQAYFNTLPTPIQDIISLAGQEISTFLPHTLTKSYNVNYGLDAEMDGLLAVPYAAATTPKHGSQFSNQHITMNYTFQTYHKIGVSETVLLKSLENLQQNALNELREEGGRILLNQTNAWNVFCQLKGDIDMPLFNFKICHLNSLQLRINSNTKLISAFVQMLVLPRLELYESKLSCNAHNLASFFDREAAFTGTLWNGASMHRKLKLEPDRGTEAKTLSILWDNSRKSVLALKETSAARLLQELKEKVDFDLISDAGGYFKEGGNLAVAREMARIFHKPVVFYNHTGQQSVTDGQVETSLKLFTKPESQRMTFLDQSHTVGADVKQKSSAVGIVTVGRGMLLRDLLQSAWRLRGLDKSQKVVFAVSHEVEQIIRQQFDKPAAEPIILDDILHFAISNQAQQQGRDNYKALKQALWNIPQKLLLDALLSKDLAGSDVKMAYEMLRTAWIKPASPSCRAVYGTLSTRRNISVVLAEEAGRCRELIDDLFQRIPALSKLGMDPRQCAAQVEEIIGHMRGSLPETVLSKDNEDDDDQTVEVEKDILVETELEVQEYRENHTPTLGFFSGPNFRECLEFTDEAIFNPVNRNRDSIPTFDISLYMAQDPSLNEWANAFRGIKMTLNVLEWNVENQTVKNTKLLGPHRTPLHFALVDNENVLLISQYDASAVQSAGRSNALQLQVDRQRLYNLTLGFTNAEMQIQPEAKKKIVKLKFLSGESSYSREEMAILREWFGEHGAVKMRRLFREKILSGRPLKAAAYQDSPLQGLFREMASA